MSEEVVSVAREVSGRRKEKGLHAEKRLASIAVGVFLLVSLALGGSALAQGTEGVELRLTPSRDSGVSGTAILTDVAAGVEVELNIHGLPEAGVEHINHIHGGGTCADDRAGRTAPVTIPLNTVVAEGDGTGSATTTIKDVTVAELFDEGEERFILLHAEAREGQGVPQGISCVDLVRTSGDDVASEVLPESGGTRPMVLVFVGLALVLLGYIACLLMPKSTQVG
jgi:hypothetical protein